MRFLADENVPMPSVRALREKGHDMAAVIETTPGTSDEGVLIRAREEDRTLVTFDSDYGTLIFRDRNVAPPAVVYFRLVPREPLEPARALQQLLKETTLAGQFTVVERQGVRQRSLRRFFPS
ncbi:MAG: hypothetical protein BRD48_02545 [Bacteroidetes bacterium QS_9_68_14]|nr:MAG: hypothetical protein BRD48_02545 [Bacteroidetes bacterium QS_9_68_14]